MHSRVRSLLRRRRLELVAAGARLGSAGLILPGEGNLSVLETADEPATILITPGGVDKARMAPQDLVPIPWDGKTTGIWRRQALPPGASSETRMHLAIYAELPGVTAVVHAHPPQALALAAGGRRPETGLLEEGRRLVGGAVLLPRLEPGTLRLAQEVAAALLEAPACVLTGHGAVTVGSTLHEALGRMLLLERLAGLTLEAG